MRRRIRPVIARRVHGLWLGLFAASLAVSAAAAGPATSGPGRGESATEQGAPVVAPSRVDPATETRPGSADFAGETASRDARRVADWVVASDDNGRLPFVIVDKVKAKVFVFDDRGRLLGAAPALLGRAVGDDSVPGIGHRKLAAIRPEERTTPAGRFMAALGHDLKQDILWVDYDAAISLHRVITGDPTDHRLRRLASARPSDRRISYGCINVPVSFYETVVLRAFSGTSGLVYILPETKPIQEVFAIPDVRASAR